MSWAEMRTLAAYEDVKKHPIAVLLVTKLSDDAQRRYETENHLDCSLEYQGIAFKRVTKETFELSKGCAKIFDFTITPTIQFLVKGKLVESPSRLSAVNSIVNRIKEHIEYNARIFQIQNLNGFSSFTASRLAVLMFYDQSLPKMSSLLNGLSICYPRVEFGIVNSAKHAINNPQIVPQIPGYPSIFVYNESKLVTKTPIKLKVLNQYLETRRTFLNDPSSKIDYVTLRDDIEAAEDTINNVAQFDPEASFKEEIIGGILVASRESSYFKMEGSFSLAEVINVNIRISSRESSTGSRSRANSITKESSAASGNGRSRASSVSREISSNFGSSDLKKANNGTSLAARRPSVLNSPIVPEAIAETNSQVPSPQNSQVSSPLDKPKLSFGTELSINSIGSVGISTKPTDIVPRRASFTPGLSPSISRIPSSVEINASGEESAKDFGGSTALLGSALGIKTLDAGGSTSTFSSLSNSRRQSLSPAFVPENVREKTILSFTNNNSVVSVKEVKENDSGSGGNFLSQSIARRPSLIPSFVPETVRETSVLTFSNNNAATHTKQAKDIGALNDSDEEIKLRRNSLKSGRSKERERVLRSNSLHSKNGTVEPQRLSSTSSRVNSTNTDASGSSTTNNGSSKMILGSAFVKMNEDSNSSLSSSSMFPKGLTIMKSTNSADGEVLNEAKNQASRVNSVKLNPQLQSALLPQNSLKQDDDKTASTRRSASVKSSKTPESFLLYLEMGRKQSLSDRPTTETRKLEESNNNLKPKSTETKEMKRNNIIPANISPPLRKTQSEHESSLLDSPPLLPNLPTALARKKSVRNQSNETEKLPTTFDFRK